MTVTVSFDVEVKGTASSQFDLGTIERRLAVLEGPADDDEAALLEILYLHKVLAEQFPEEQANGRGASSSAGNSALHDAGPNPGTGSGAEPD